MNETSTHQPNVDRNARKLELYKEMHELAQRYFHGPFIVPDTRDTIGRRLRDVMLTIDILNHSD